MRPIERGNVPLNEDGTPKTVSDYKNWRKDLLDRLGNYCSYCEMALNDSPQVEHVIAQDVDSALALEWINMLLACSACNRAKWNHLCPSATHYLPTHHNTFLSFRLLKTKNLRHQDEAASFVIVNPILQANQRLKAQNTVDLCRLNVDFTAIRSEQKVTDLRWRYRREAIFDAELWRKEWDDWGQNSANQFIELLITNAKAKGFWTAWFTVFQDVRAVREALINGFKGTAIGCFDDDYNPIPRNPSNTVDPI